jgi:hypothetical protein
MDKLTPLQIKRKQAKREYESARQRVKELTEELALAESREVEAGNKYVYWLSVPDAK